MRVTGGRYAGRQLISPKGPRIRPTQDRVRQALFNILGNRVEGAKALDLFSGSGAMGIEALSRGASHVTFVDCSGFCTRAIRTNLERLGHVSHAEWSTRGGADSQGGYIPDSSFCSNRVIQVNVQEAIRRFDRAGEQFDLVLLDPPYDEDLARKTLMELSRYAIVSETGWVVAEHNKRGPLPENLEGKSNRLVSQRVEIYGDTALAFYQRQ